MPVTARLSRLFYDRMGEQITNELVNWFNVVEETSRTDLRALNELNYARFEAKLEQRLAELETRLSDKFDAKLDAKFEPLARQVAAKLDRAEAEQMFARWSANLEDKFGLKLDARIERAQKEQTRLMLLAWMTILIPMIGLWMRR